MEPASLGALPARRRSASRSSETSSPMRMTPLISPPSCTNSLRVAMSPWTTLVPWISTRSSAWIPPRTSPPTMASRVNTSPSTTPPLATSTWRAARTVPTTVPSTFITPSANRSPVTFIPAPMIDSPVTASAGPCPFSAKIAISASLLDQRERVDGPAPAADFEVQVWRGGSSGAAGEGDHLPRADLIPLAHQETRGVSIHRLIPVGMAQEHELPVVRVGAGFLHRGAAGGPHGRAFRHGEVDPDVGLARVAGAHLPARQEAGRVHGPVRRDGRSLFI